MVLLPATTTRAELALHTPAAAVLEAFLATRDSPHTRRAYRRAVEQALATMGMETLADVSGAALAAYRAERTGSGLAPGSVALELAALRSFFGWARAMGAHDIPGEVVRTALRTPPATVQRPYQVLNEGEIVDVLAAADTARDRALVAVMVGAGLRVAELVALDVLDLHEDGDGETVLHVRQGKGRRDRSVPIRADVAQLVRAYLHETGRTLGSEGPLFRAHDRGAAGRRRQRLSTRGVAAVVERLVARAGIQGKALSPHSLRHTMALRSLRHGADVVALAKLLGHARLTTTQRYVDHLGLDELREAVPPLPA